MQIKLIPVAPHPTILFNVTLHDPPEHLGIPPAWAAQLHRLGSEELEYPQTVLALDKTTWLIACLTSVTFDLSGTREGSLDEGDGAATEEEGSVPGRVICLFVDGKVLEWELSSAQMEGTDALACVRMLESVCQAVQDSAVEAERERRRSMAPESRPLTPTTTATEESSTQSSEKGESKKHGKHKRQRSLLKSLVASLVSFQSPSQPPPAPALLPPPAPPSPVVRPASPVRPYSTSNLSTELRKRARSALVDAFRRFVLTRLAATVLPICACVELQATYNSHIGYFATWITQSMLERVEAEMETLVHEAGGVPSVYMNTVVSSQSGMREQLSPNSPGFSPRGDSHVERLVDEMLPPFLDGNDGTDESDGSSVHTPPDGTPAEASPFIPEREASSSPSQTTHKHAPPTSAFPRSPSPPTPPNLSPPLPLSGIPASPTDATGISPSSMSSSITIAMPQPPQPTFSPAALTAYTALSTHRIRLRNLLGRLSAQADILLSEDRALQAALEIKGRRRAWSNREYMRKDCADMRFLGFAVPTRRSPLGRSEPICASDIFTVSASSSSSAQADSYVVEGVNGPGKHRRRPSDTGLVVTTADHNIMRLFPVCEEDEDDEYHFDYPLPSSPSDMSFTDSPSARLVEDSILRNAEAGLLPSLSMQRHSVPVRSRTRSMIQAAPSLLPTPPLSPVTTAPSSEVDTASPSPTPPASLFPEVDEEKIEFDVLEPQTKVELFDVYSGEDEEEDGSAEELGFRSEFTLSMDLPPPYRMDIGMHAMTRGYDKWVVDHRTTGSAGC